MLLFVVAAYSGGTLRDINQGRIHIFEEQEGNEVGHFDMQRTGGSVDVVAAMFADGSGRRRTWVLRTLHLPAQHGQHFMDILPLLTSVIRSCIPSAPSKQKVAFAMQKGGVMGLASGMQRILVGLVLGEIMGPATFAGGWPFVLAYGAVVFLISAEYNAMLKKVLRPPLVPALRWCLWAVSTSTLLAAHLGVLTGIFETTSITLLVLLLLLQGNKVQPDGELPIKFSHISSQVFGVFYVGYLPSFWVRLRSISLGLAQEPSAALRGLVPPGCRPLGAMGAVGGDLGLDAQ